MKSFRYALRYPPIIGPRDGFYAEPRAQSGQSDRVIRWSFGQNAPSQQAPAEPSAPYIYPSVIIPDLPLTQAGAAWALLNRLSTDPTQEHAAIVVCTGDDTGLAEHSAALQRHAYAVLPTPFDLNDLAALRPRLIPAHGTRAWPYHVRLLAGVPSAACFVRLLPVRSSINQG